MRNLKCFIFQFHPFSISSSFRFFIFIFDFWSLFSIFHLHLFLYNPIGSDTCNNWKMKRDISPQIPSSTWESKTAPQTRNGTGTIPYGLYRRPLGSLTSLTVAVALDWLPKETGWTTESLSFWCALSIRHCTCEPWFCSTPGSRDILVSHRPNTDSPSPMQHPTTVGFINQVVVFIHPIQNLLMGLCIGEEDDRVGLLGGIWKDLCYQ